MIQHGESDEQSVQLDYNYLVLNHLNRMSFLTSVRQGTITNAQGNLVQYGETDRYLALHWSTNFLEVLLPKVIRDEEYQEDSSQISEEWKKEAERLDKAEKESTIRNEGMIARARMDLKRVKAGVNLLARKGFLFDNMQAVELPPRRNKEDPR